MFAEDNLAIQIFKLDFVIVFTIAPWLSRRQVNIRWREKAEQEQWRRRGCVLTMES